MAMTQTVTAEGTKQAFDVELRRGGEGDNWTLFTVPFDVVRVFGAKTRVAVKGTINGFPYRTSIFPMGDGEFCMMVNREMQHGAKVTPGERVQIEMEPDTGPRLLLVPDDLAAAIRTSSQAAAGWEKLSYSRQKLVVDWVEEAKRAETRAARIEKAVPLLAEGKPVR